MFDRLIEFHCRHIAKDYTIYFAIWPAGDRQTISLFARKGGDACFSKLFVARSHDRATIYELSDYVCHELLSASARTSQKFEIRVSVAVTDPTSPRGSAFFCTPSFLLKSPNFFKSKRAQAYVKNKVVDFKVQFTSTRVSFDLSVVAAQYICIFDSCCVMAKSLTKCFRGVPRIFFSS